jgi:hypothetical protein
MPPSVDDENSGMEAAPRSVAFEELGCIGYTHSQIHGLHIDEYSRIQIEHCSSVSAFEDSAVATSIFRWLELSSC